jgi:hypothetical protein
VDRTLRCLLRSTRREDHIAGVQGGMKNGQLLGALGDPRRSVMFTPEVRTRPVHALTNVHTQTYMHAHTYIHSTHTHIYIYTCTATTTRAHLPVKMDTLTVGRHGHRTMRAM